MKKLAILDITMCAAAAALHIVLELFLTIRIGDSLKITLAALPFLVIAFLCGPIEGMISGLIGTFLSQLLTYGITATTVLWVLPYAVQALIAGLIFIAYKKKVTLLSIAVSIFVSGFVQVAITWLASYVDGVIVYKYMTAEVLIGLIPIRIAVWACISAAYTLICIPLTMAAIKSSPAGLKKSRANAAAK